MFIALLFLALGVLVVWQLLQGTVPLLKLSRHEQGTAYWVTIAVQGLGLLWLLGTGQPTAYLPQLTTALNQLPTITIPTVPPPPTAATCEIATDTTYAFQPSNPVRMGGGSFGGAQRTSYYLQQLRGPRGEEINYYPQGEVLFEGAPLQAIKLSYNGLANDLVIFVDHYHESPPLAPAGLTCAGRFDFPK